MKDIAIRSSCTALQNLSAAAVLALALTLGGILARGPDDGDGGGIGTDPGTGIDCGGVISGRSSPLGGTAGGDAVQTSPDDTVAPTTVE